MTIHVVCNVNIVNGKHGQVTIKEKATHWIPSPFKRNDLFGIMDAINADRVTVDWSPDIDRPELNLIKRDVDGETTRLLYTKDIQKTLYFWDRNKEQVDFLERLMGTIETGLYQQQVIVMKNFTSPEVCQAILDAVRFGVGLDMASGKAKRGDDGFAGTTEDGVDQVVMRQSSQIFLHPTLSDKKFAPSINRLLTKMSLLTGIPIDHVETPIKIEKFVAGDFRKGASHFQDGVRTMEGTRYLDSHVLPGEEYYDLSFPSTLTMENARLFGITLFLSDVDQGGSLYFPNMSQGIRIDPEIGKAVLFPTVVSLNGNWDSRMHIDDPYEHNGEGASYLVEDRTTLLGHDAVTSGTKYSVTIYFRRYEDDYDDDE